jgi:hypothetical protein
VFKFGLFLAVGSAFAVASSWITEYASSGNPTGGTNSIVESDQLKLVDRWPMPVDLAWPASAPGTTADSNPESIERGVPCDAFGRPLAPNPDTATRWSVSGGLELRWMAGYTQREAFYLREIRSGWPVRCMHRFLASRSPMTFSRSPMPSRPASPLYGGLDLLGNEKKLEPRGTSRGPAFFPLLPLWGGLAINAAFYALAAWLVSAGFMSARRTLRRRRGLCGWCGYPRNSSIVCTECGRN